MVPVQRAANNNHLCCKLARLARMHGEINCIEEGAVGLSLFFFFSNLMYLLRVLIINCSHPSNAGETRGE